MGESEAHNEPSDEQDAIILALGELVRKEISADALLNRIVDVMARHLDADRGTIFLLEPDGKALVSVAAHLPEIERIRVPITQGVAGYVARTGKLVNIPFCDDDVNFWKDVDAKTGYETVSMLAAPLNDRNGGLIGVVQFLNKRSGIFEAQDERTFERLAEQVAKLLEETTLGSGRNFLPDASSEPLPPPIGDRINRIVGNSQAMRGVFERLRKVAPTDATVLLRGESGTGKGLVARALHHNSNRRDGPFVHVDCTTLPDGLMENELFGHERGAYTGADAQKTGKVEAASGGTLFLDEIGELPPRLQSKLLTLLQEKSYHRVGGTERLTADIRIVAATNQPLEERVAQGDFREDLYYRLRVVQMTLPPLRDRGRDDLELLINHFVSVAARKHRRSISGIRPDALSMLLSYQWPGNVRELENCLESAVIFAEGEITPSTLPLPRPGTSQLLLKAALVDQPAGENGSPFTDQPSLSELEKRYIAWLLAQHDDNRSACARILGIGRNTLLRKIREYGLE